MKFWIFTHAPKVFLLFGVLACSPFCAYAQDENSLLDKLDKVRQDRNDFYERWQECENRKDLCNQQLIDNDRIITHLEEEAAVLESEKINLEQDIARHLATIEGLQGDLRQAREKIKQLEGKVEYLEGALQKANERIDCLRQEQNRLWQRSRDLHQALSALYTQWARADKKAQSLEQQLKAMDLHRIELEKSLGDYQSNVARKTMLFSGGIKMSISPLLARNRPYNRLQFISQLGANGLRAGDLGMSFLVAGIGASFNFPYRLPNATVNFSPDFCETIYKYRGIEDVKDERNEPYIPLRYLGDQGIDMRANQVQLMVNPFQFLYTLSKRKKKNGHEEFIQPFYLIAGWGWLKGTFWESYEGDLGADARPIFTDVNTGINHYAANCRYDNNGGIVLGVAAAGPMIPFKDDKIAIGYQAEAIYSDLWGTYNVSIGISIGGTINSFNGAFKKKIPAWPPRDIAQEAIEANMYDEGALILQERAQEIEQKFIPQEALDSTQYKQLSQEIREEFAQFMNRELAFRLKDVYRQLYKQPDFKDHLKYFEEEDTTEEIVATQVALLLELANFQQQHIIDQLRKKVCNE